MALALKVITPLTLAAALAVIAACDNGPSAVATKQQVDTPPAGEAPRSGVASSQEAETPKVDGKPMWSANRNHTAQENAQRAFERNGADFGAKDVDDFVHKAHAFAEAPPPGTASMTRSNGDVLLYDAKSNVFMVVSKLGAPRTMFKPDEGKTYWDEQKAREANRNKTAANKGASEG